MLIQKGEGRFLAQIVGDSISGLLLSRDLRQNFSIQVLGSTYKSKTPEGKWKYQLSLSELVLILLFVSSTQNITLWKLYLVKINILSRISIFVSVVLSCHTHSGYLKDKSQPEAFFMWRFHHTVPLTRNIDDPLPVQEQRLGQLIFPPPKNF